MERVLAYAKLNLSLSVGRLTGGYHDLDSVVCPISLADEIELLADGCETRTEWRAGKAETTGIPRENNCDKAIRLLAAATGRRGAAVRVTRNIPDRGGLGGSSAAAAGVLRLLGARWNADARTLCGVADAVGSDVRVMLCGGLARMRGRGERVEPLGFRPRLWFVVAMSGAVGTADVFRAFDAMRNRASAADSARLCASLARGEFEGLGNDLTAAAVTLEPRIEDVLAGLAATRPAAYGMTGSGAACFGVYRGEAEARAAAEAVDAAFKTVCEAVYFDGIDGVLSCD